MLLASTLWSCLHTWWWFDFFLIAEHFKWAAVCIDFAYPAHTFLLISLIGFSFPLYPWNLFFHGHHWFYSQYNGLFQFLFLFDLVQAFDADIYLCGILALTLCDAGLLVFSLPCWDSLVLFFLFPFLKPLSSLGLSLDFAVLYKKLLTVNFIFKLEPIKTSST